MKILVTAGPTREYIDDVRYVSNASSGKMGYAVARAAKKAGHDVVLVKGPTELKPPSGIPCVNVVSARQMKGAVDEFLPWCDAMIMAAAVADYRPVRRVKGKIKKESEKLVVEMKKNPDILKGDSRKKEGRLLVGFALESVHLREQATEKLRAKKLDLIVGNAPASIARERTTALVIDRDGNEYEHDDVKKSSLARTVIKRLEKLAGIEPKKKKKARSGG